MKNGALFSPCRTYRYVLQREWGYTGVNAVFIGLNPSTADETKDDPTIRRCIGYAKAWHCDGLIMLNLFAFRATDPNVMRAAADPVGPDNDKWLKRLCGFTAVAAWGTHGTYRNRENEVRALLPNLHCLKLTKDGHPAHPLYLPKTLKPIAWSQPC